MKKFLYYNTLKKENGEKSTTIITIALLYTRKFKKLI